MHSLRMHKATYGCAFLFGACVLPLAAGGCFDFCQTQALPSVEVEVVDAAGQPITSAEVTYTVNGGSVESAECIGWGDDGCGTWGAGTEQTGLFFVTAKSPDGSLGRSGAYVLEGDCGVQTQEVRIVVE